ncbi:hypothetical protein ACFT54_09890 [Streptomyces cinereoruber]
MIYGYLALGLVGMLIDLLGRGDNVREVGRLCAAGAFVLIALTWDVQ